MADFNRMTETVSEREKRLTSVATEILKVISSNQLTVFEFNRVLVILKDLAESRTIVQD